jgi:hypothetical protein
VRKPIKIGNVPRQKRQIQANSRPRDGNCAILDRYGPRRHSTSEILGVPPAITLAGW